MVQWEGGGGGPKVRCGPATQLRPRLPSHGPHRLLSPNACPRPSPCPVLPAAPSPPRHGPASGSGRPRPRTSVHWPVLGSWASGPCPMFTLPVCLACFACAGPFGLTPFIRLSPGHGGCGGCRSRVNRADHCHRSWLCEWSLELKNPQWVLHLGTPPPHVHPPPPSGTTVPPHPKGGDCHQLTIT